MLRFEHFWFWKWQFQINRQEPLWDYIALYNNRKIQSQWFLKCRKMAKYSLVMTPTPCRVAGCIISVRRTYSCTPALTYLHSWLGRIKPATSPKRLKIERKLLLTAYIKSYTGFRLPPECMTLNDLWARFKVILRPKCRKNWRNTAE